MHHSKLNHNAFHIGAAPGFGSSAGLGSVAPQKCETQQREIPRELEALCGQLSTLEAVAESLVQQLAPVLISYPEPPSDNELNQSISTSLGSEIDSVRRRVLILTQRLSSAASGLAV
jgi:hypothetical protein